MKSLGTFKNLTSSVKYEALADDDNIYTIPLKLFNVNAPDERDVSGIWDANAFGKNFVKAV